MLVPYFSRIPTAFVRGTPWIWSYMSTTDDVLRWNGLHIISLIPLGITGLIYIFGRHSWGFYVAFAGYVAATSFVYYHQGNPPGPDDFLGCIVFPPMLAFASGVCGAVALAAQLIVQKRRSQITNAST